MKNRLIGEGLITTLIGLGMLVFLGSLIWTNKSTAGELSGWLALSIMFLRSKDTLLHIGKDENNN